MLTQSAAADTGLLFSNVSSPFGPSGYGGQAGTSPLRIVPNFRLTWMGAVPIAAKPARHLRIEVSGV